MFATLTGALPRTPVSGPTLDELDARAAAGEIGAEAVREAADALVLDWLGVQEAAGLEPLTDGQVRSATLALRVARALEGVEVSGAVARAVALPRRGDKLVVEDWRFAAAATGRVVKQALPGPYSLGRRLTAAGDGDADGPDRGARPGRRAVTLALADALRDELRDLAAAGCPMAEVEEPDAISIGAEPAERRLFRDAHERLLDGVAGTHVTLALTGGDVAAAGAETIVGAPYASILLDLIRGPDGWRLVTALGGERGVICGVLPVDRDRAGDLALMAWAAGYAASTAGRGIARVGLAPAGGLGHLDREAAVSKIARIGEAARLVASGGSSAGGAVVPARRVVRGMPGASVPGRPPRPRRRRG